METVTLNLTAAPRRDNSLGREYLVAPLTMLVPGVLNGSRGALLYEAEEVSRDPGRWNGMPITRGHPTIGGQNVSGRSPAVWAQYLIGHVFNAHADTDGRLKGEGWFDVAALRRLDPKLLRDLESGQKVGLSTGLYTTNVPAAPGATWNGRGYEAVARNLIPDHLAILEAGTPGACDLADGCGVNNAEGSEPHGPTDNAYPHEHAARTASPDEFDPRSFRRKEIAPGISIVVAKRKNGSGSMEVQSYRFDSSRFSPAEARAWLKKHDVSAKFEEARTDNRDFSSDEERKAAFAHMKGKEGGSGGTGGPAKASEEVLSAVERAFNDLGGEHVGAGRVIDAETLRETAAAYTGKAIPRDVFHAALEQLRAEGKKVPAPTKNASGVRADMDTNDDRRTVWQRLGEALGITGGASHPDDPTANAAVTKKEGSETLTFEDYAYGDPQMPSTWKLRITDARHVGAAIAAIGPKGYRGQKADIPAADLPAVKRKLRAAWKKFNPDRPDSEMPSIVANAGPGMGMKDKPGMPDMPGMDMPGMADADAAAEEPNDGMTCPNCGSKATRNAKTKLCDNCGGDWPMAGDKPVGGAKTMTGNERQATIDWLTTNCDCWKGKAGVLANADAFPDDDLARLRASAEKHRALELTANAAARPFEKDGVVFTFNAASGAWEGKPKPPPAPATPPPARPMTDEEWLATAPPRIKAALEQAIAINQRERDAVIARLTANVADEAARQRAAAVYAALPAEQLAALAAALPPEPAGAAFGLGYPSYAGAAAGPSPYRLTDNEAADVLDLEAIRAEHDKAAQAG